MSMDREQLDAIWAALDDGSADAEPPSARELNLRSLEALGRSITEPIGEAWATVGPLEGATRANVRLHGGAVVGHRVGVRLAARALTAFQDLVSSLVMSARDKKSMFGQVPEEVRVAAELFLSPRPAPGSVVFELTGPPAAHDNRALPGLTDGANDADRAAAVLSRVLAEAALDDRTVLSEDLRQLGPRVAINLQRMATLSIKERLSIELEWVQGSGARVSGRFGAAEAAVLREVIAESRASVERQTLRGQLVTVSSEDALALRLTDGKRVSLTVAPDFDVSSLGAYYNAFVLVEVEVEIISHPTTAREQSRYTLMAIGAAFDEIEQGALDLDGSPSDEAP